MRFHYYLTLAYCVPPPPPLSAMVSWWSSNRRLVIGVGVIAFVSVFIVLIILSSLRSENPQDCDSWFCTGSPPTPSPLIESLSSDEIKT